MKFHAALAVAALGSAATACLLPEEMAAENERALTGTTSYRRHVPKIDKRQRRADMPIGKGDRFSNGSVVPIGLSKKNRDLQTILTPQEIGSGLSALAKTFPDLKLFTAPKKTFEGKSMPGAVIGKDPRVFIMSGIHARERGGPDDVLYFLSDLLHANKEGTGITYGKKTYTAAEVKKALSAGLVVLPMVNPDGVAYDQSSNSCWRKNRNTKSSKRGGSDVGIDLNRNFDFLFDYKKAFSPKAELGSAASDNPASEIFQGTAPFSEPETDNVAWIMDQHPNIGYFLDLHSYGGMILYGWGDDNPQFTDPAQNFSTPAYDGKRGVLGNDPADSRYKEYLVKEDEDDQLAVSNRMHAAMALAGPTPYEVQPTVDLYPTAGASTDYALGRYYGHTCGANKIQGFTVEFGQSSGSSACPFYPSNAQYHTWMKEVQAGFMEFLLHAAEQGEPEKWKC